jgi:hypothetical protein
MSQPRTPTEFQRQHQNRIAALMARVAADGQAGAWSSSRAYRRPIGRPPTVTVLTRDDARMEFKSLTDAARYLGVDPGSVWNVMSRGSRIHGWRVERV